MGLESVELIIEVEKYFNIQIPNREAERIYTVQNLVDAVALHLNITSEDTSLRNKIFEAVTLSIRTIYNTNLTLSLTKKVHHFLSPHDKEKWESIQNKLGLNIPIPDAFPTASNNLRDKFKKLINWAPNYLWQDISFEQFVSSICAHNYQDLVDRTKVNSKYEIYIAVMGITVEKVGVDYYEISPDKSFTTDLGID